MSSLMVASNSQMSIGAPIREGNDLEIWPSLLHRHGYIDAFQDRSYITELIAAWGEASNVSKSYDERIHIYGFVNSLAQRLQYAKHQVQNLSQTAGHDNWDDEGADKVATETVSVALELLATFPYSEHPDILGEDLDIEATPFGSIDFGWALEQDVRMNVIALSSGEIGFAYSVHGERDNGKVPWEGQLPHFVWEVFDRVFNREGLGD